MLLFLEHNINYICYYIIFILERQQRHFYLIYLIYYIMLFIKKSEEIHVIIYQYYTNCFGGFIRFILM